MHSTRQRLRGIMKKEVQDSVGAALVKEITYRLVYLHLQYKSVGKYDLIYNNSVCSQLFRETTHEAN